ncbi:hypothetical protein PV755_09160 [Streptomyces caniscabiei]|uniref:Uncharacterized protein n=1 Tax=Streptomyces caniscabiei TaxID=2746961 RepID=A0A927L3E9_9ACTN|nr:hypothetical protein [Streptomyces caniscabiei]MBD9721898.1 hypothetical protein [Streptomyces caniscabiei]MDX3509089.1 hypothetical protein [Streptomyces caniscabiei]MDX3717158.1 hypothetical protein [Streptomyces caniscabiei]WEO23025.1 hypothetical protein IHE65_07565 [Streptomyces caniscabiei]
MNQTSEPRQVEVGDTIRDRSAFREIAGVVFLVTRAVAYFQCSAERCSCQLPVSHGSRSTHGAWRTNLDWEVVPARHASGNPAHIWGPGGVRDEDDTAKRVVAGGGHYLLGDDNSDSPTAYRGFDGRRFTIEFFDGRTVSSGDLWYQGVIPPKWRSRFPDNARFVQAQGGAR